MFKRKQSIFLLSVISSCMIVLVVFSSGNKTLVKDEKILKIAENSNVTLKDILKCDDKVLVAKIEYHAEYIMLTNFIKAEKQHSCEESITLTAPADFRFLDNVVTLVEKWEGPISVALYAPGYDFFSSLQSIAYLRKCSGAKDLIRRFVSFHLFFEHDHIPNQVGFLFDAYKDKFNCEDKPPYETIKDEELYKSRQNLTYPINLARNIAKLNAQTHFVFPSDIELYPTKQFIPKFLEFIKNNQKYVEPQSRNVFVLPVFEVLAGQQVPENKTELQKMFKDKTAILFHKTVCSLCHRIPNDTNWMKHAETIGINVFVSSKRVGRYRVWEPFFVCTQKEPLWDERFNWEGQNNKMVQAYHLCMLGYNFFVLDNAFLVHKPGIKKKKIQNIKFGDQKKKNQRLIREIKNELTRLYGENKNCSVIYNEK